MAMINSVSSKQKAESRNSNSAYCLLPTAYYSRGFALLISIIFMSVMLALGLALSSLGYKQALLASTAIQSQYAFYVADAGMECALYADQQQNLFAYPPSEPSSAPAMTCDGSAPFSAPTFSYSPTQWTITTRLSLDAGKHCADVTVYKPASLGMSYFFSQGYNVPCATVANPGGARFVSRGLKTKYSSSPESPSSSGQVAYTTPGTYSWTAPEGVTSVSVVAVGGGGGAHDAGGAGGGLGYNNNITVVPGSNYLVVVGSGGGTNADGGDSYFINTSTVKGGGGERGVPGSSGGANGGNYVGDGGGNGGGAQDNGGAGEIYTGGGGAGGYSGSGGAGGRTGSGSDGSGGAGGGGGGTINDDLADDFGGGGGGVGILGRGTNGTGGAPRTGGTGGSDGATGGSSPNGYGGSYGGGAAEGGASGSGAVRIIWPGDTRQFPSTNTEDM
ncbi:MAG: hypothetical protein Q8O94_00260 [bacterium]|nr:hypothetical protein [bacterium]